MVRPWVSPKEVRDYSDSEKVKAREDNKLMFDIARAEKYVIHHTHNHFDAAEYGRITAIRCKDGSDSSC